MTVTLFPSALVKCGNSHRILDMRGTLYDELNAILVNIILAFISKDFRVS